MSTTKPDYSEYIKKLVDDAPPLTPEIRDRIATLFKVTPRAGCAA